MRLRYLCVGFRGIFILELLLCKLLIDMVGIIHTIIIAAMIRLLTLLRIGMNVLCV